MEKHFLFICGFLLLSLFEAAKAVKIHTLTVPQRYDLKHDGNDSIQLECDFSVNEKDSGFVLKWLHNNVPIYQWIPSRPPFAIGSFRDRIDLTHSQSDERLKKHSALIITKPLLTDSGNFTCNVQTFQGSDKQSAEMQIIDPEDSMKLEYEFKENNTVQFKCSVTKIYPVPVVQLLFDNKERDFVVETEEKLVEGVSDISITTNVVRSEIEDESPVTCVLSIPNSDYTRSETTIYDANGAMILRSSPLGLLIVTTVLFSQLRF